EKIRHKSNTAYSHENPVDDCQHSAPGSRSVCGIFIFRPKIKGDQSVDSHAETDGNGVDEILDRIDQRQSSHGVFTDSGDKVAVHDIVKGIDQHGDYHGKRHGHD